MLSATTAIATTATTTPATTIARGDGPRRGAPPRARSTATAVDGRGAHRSRAHSVTCCAAQHERDQHGRADERDDDAGLHLAREGDDAPDHVGEQQQARAGRDADRQQPPVVVADDHAQRVRDHEADEDDRPGDRRRAAAQQDRREDAEPPRAVHVMAESGRGVGAERDEVEAPCAEQRECRFRRRSG